jgi:membrane-associated phospholipid phosphatase
MRHAEWINVFTFAIFAVMAWVCPLAANRRVRALVICNAGVLLVLLSISLESSLSQSSVSVIRDWLPSVLILLAYWTAGAFVSMPSERLQRILLDFDARLLKPAWLKRSRPNHLLPAYLEVAYLLCYPLIPAGVGVLYWSGLRQEVDDYWSVVLPSTYACYLVQPLSKALPPRLVCADDKTECTPDIFRRLNLLIHRHASIRFITLPSAHVASTMAASLVLLWFVPPAGVVFVALSVSIAVGAVIGRYHYAADVLLGAGVAVFVFLITSPVFT